MLYATQYGDLKSVKNLIALGVSLDTSDYDGRTPLLIASSEGYYDIVIHLLGKGAQISQLDARGFDARSEAMRFGRTTVYDLINSVKSNVIVKEQCKVFSRGVFSNGMGSAIGAYHKKFEDFQILLNSTTDSFKRLSLTRIARFQNQVPPGFVPFN